MQISLRRLATVTERLPGTGSLRTVDRLDPWIHGSFGSCLCLIVLIVHAKIRCRAGDSRRIWLLRNSPAISSKG